MIKVKPKNQGLKSAAAKLKAAGIPGGVEVPRKGAWQQAREKGISVGGPKATKHTNKPLTLSNDAREEMALMKAGGASTKQIAQKFELSDQYVADSLRKYYVSSARGREILQGVLLETAIAAGEHTRAKIDELTGAQAAVVTGIMTSRYIDLSKHNAGAGVDVDLKQVAAAGHRLSLIGNALQQVDEQLGSNINVLED